MPPDLVRPAVRLAVSGEAALLNSTTAAAAERMFAAAAADGVVITLASGYRSFATQKVTYNGWVRAQGQAGGRHGLRPAGLFRASDGLGFRYRRRQRGGRFPAQFPLTGRRPYGPAAQAHRFGFVVRYPWMFHEITGYFYEPWHLRYIGVEAATDMKTRGIATLEQYFGLEAAPGYL